MRQGIFFFLLEIIIQIFPIGPKPIFNKDSVASIVINILLYVYIYNTFLL